jgi:hypothetical protein
MRSRQTCNVGASGSHGTQTSTFVRKSSDEHRETAESIAGPAGDPAGVTSEPVDATNAPAER